MNTFKECFSGLQKVYHKFDEENNALKLSLLKEISKTKLPLNNSILDYYNVLLFLCAHPLNDEILSIAESELNRLAKNLKDAGKPTQLKFQNSGLPYTSVVSTFSQDLLKWMFANGNYKIDVDSFAGEKGQLNSVLQFTLPALEKEITTLELSETNLFKKLKVKKQDRIPFLLNELERLEPKTYLKDHLFNSLGMYVNVDSTDQKLSKSFNRIKFAQVYYQKDILKNFDHLVLFNTKLPKPKKLSEKELEDLNVCVKNALIVLQRETDPVSYVDKNSIRLYELERGISVAIYGMTPERQLPLESYVGYTLFKNGFPAAYGGGWVFGKRSLFGINIFEPMRGGESGFILCQLLRVYRQAFGVDYFEVEPYQYGKGNPEGIKSGAFWFYYHFGFRPADQLLNTLAKEEAGKIASTKGYRTGEEVLRKFTQSNLVLNFKKETPVSLWDIREKVTAMIAQKFEGNRVEAEKQCVKNFLKKCGGIKSLTADQKVVLADVALVVEAMNISSVSKIKFLKELISLKPADLYRYQETLSKALA